MKIRFGSISATRATFSSVCVNHHDQPTLRVRLPMQRRGGFFSSPEKIEERSEVLMKQVVSFA